MQNILTDRALIENVLNTIDGLRTKKEFSIHRLAIEAGLSENTLKYIFKRRSCPSLITLNRLCHAFEIPLWQFFLLSNVEQRLPLKEYELLRHFENLTEAHKDLLIYIAKQLSE